MKNQSSLPGAFLGKSGSLYIRVRKVIAENNELYTTQTAVYPSVESYNKCSAVPHYVELSTIVDDYSSTVSIDMTALAIATDNEPTDSDVSPT